MNDITETELIEFLINQINLDDDPAEQGWMTSKHMMTALGWSKMILMRKLTAAVDAGLVESKWIKVPDITGRMTARPHYRVIKEIDR